MSVSDSVRHGAEQVLDAQVHQVQHGERVERGERDVQQRGREEDDAVIVMPGGFGTLDELMEVVTLVQTKKMNKPMPIVLFGTEFWKSVVNFEALVEQGTISAADLDLFRYTDDPEEAWGFIKAFYKL